MIVLLLIGSDSRQLRGAGAAAALAAVVLLVPLVLALVGEDYYIPRALMPRWIPLAVVVAAACTAPRASVAGAVLAVILLASFVYAQVKVNDSPQYQRPDWRGVGRRRSAPRAARARSSRRRVARHRSARHLPSARPLDGAGNGAVTVGEVDVVGYRWQTLGRPLPAGARLISTKTVDDFVVDRFALEPHGPLTRAQIAATAGSLLGPPVVGSGGARSELPAAALTRGPSVILILHNRYRTTGGEERAVAELAALLGRRGHGSRCSSARATRRARAGGARSARRRARSRRDRRDRAPPRRGGRSCPQHPSDARLARTRRRPGRGRADAAPSPQLPAVLRDRHLLSNTMSRAAAET